MALTNSEKSRFFLADLTGEVQSIPNTYGYISNLGLFRSAPITQTTFLMQSQSAPRLTSSKRRLACRFHRLNAFLRHRDKRPGGGASPWKSSFPARGRVVAIGP